MTDQQRPESVASQRSEHGGCRLNEGGVVEQAADEEPLPGTVDDGIQTAQVPSTVATVVDGTETAQVPSIVVEVVDGAEEEEFCGHLRQRRIPNAPGDEAQMPSCPACAAGQQTPADMQLANEGIAEIEKAMEPIQAEIHRLQAFLDTKKACLDTKKAEMAPFRELVRQTMQRNIDLADEIIKIDRQQSDCDRAQRALDEVERKPRNFFDDVRRSKRLAGKLSLETMIPGNSIPLTFFKDATRSNHGLGFRMGSKHDVYTAVAAAPVAGLETAQPPASLVEGATSADFHERALEQFGKGIFKGGSFEDRVSATQQALFGKASSKEDREKKGL
ncbi:hypothetical protein LTR36_006474 [Oleoguttula mirabilis]|uniref:Uncharacterized protein n=1 Tax=Oleoguttula mirabilis TaxID=1507867 RepID=A0AAV9JUS7_9PEZI|nr:hypothetical protein LTR36_006474 [Oleoguttula mirabilis]